jgi:cytochrome c oxidase assembly protein subunit 15
MRSFRFSAFASIIATYALIFIGGLVRVSGAGLGCPDWPKCFGHWYPPLSPDDLPAYIDPVRFNFTLAWIEYGNRLVGVLVGLAILVTAILALLYYRRYRKVLIPSLTAAVLVAFQGWLGGVVVTMELKPILVSAHLVLAFATALLLLYAFLHSYYIDRSLKSESVYPPQARPLLVGLGIFTTIQILLGAQVRGHLEQIADQFPLLSDFEWLTRIGAFHDIHMVVGTLTVLTALVSGFFILRLSEMPTRVTRDAVWLMMGLAVAQLGIGLSFLAAGLLPILQLFHLWLAALLIGCELVVFVTIAAEYALPEDIQQTINKGVIAGVVMTALLTTAGFAVIKEAELSRSNMGSYSRLPEFMLIDTEGKAFSLSDMRGKVSLVNFTCVDCDPRAAGASVAMAHLYEKYQHSDRLQFISITTDPDRDTPDALRQYATELGVGDGRWRFLWGKPDEIRQLIEEGFHMSWDLSYERRTSLVLVDQAGRVRGFYEYDNPDVIELLQEHIRQLVRQG